MHHGGPSLPRPALGVIVAAAMASTPTTVIHVPSETFRTLIACSSRSDTAASRRKDRLTVCVLVTGQNAIRRSYASAPEVRRDGIQARSPLLQRHATKANPAKAGDAKLRGYRALIDEWRHASRAAEQILIFGGLYALTGN